MNKKGISTIVATVLIILITVAAVTIIWAAIIPMIKDNLYGSSDCMDAQAQISLGTGGFTCINSTNGNISLQIMHGSKDFQLARVQVIIHTAGNTATEYINNSLPEQNQEKVFFLSSPYPNATKLDIAPVIKTGNTEKNCGIAQSIDLQACA
jgi:hypothetical protein